MDILTDPAKLPADRAAIPDDTVIGTAVWAALQGVAVQTVQKQRVVAEHRRRAEAEYQKALAAYKQKLDAWEAKGRIGREPKAPAEPGAGDLPRAYDMPAEDGKIGQSPYWTMATYRQWEPTRPGRGHGAGRPATGRARRIRTVRLPLTVTCPCGCGKTFQVTETDVREGKVKTGGGKAA